MRGATKQVRQAAERAVEVGAALKNAARNGSKAELRQCLADARAVIADLMLLLVTDTPDARQTRH